MTHLLIIEDNVRVAQAIQLMLDFAMYTADFVQDGQKRWRHYKTHRRPCRMLS